MILPVNPTKSAGVSKSMGEIASSQSRTVKSGGAKAAIVVRVTSAIHCTEENPQCLMKSAL